MPILRRSHSSGGPLSIDPYDQAEQGLQVDSINPSSARQPLEAKKTLSLRYSLRSSDSTLVGVSGEPFELAVHNRGANPLPRQGKYRSVIWSYPMKCVTELPRRSTTWSARCMKSMQWLSLLQSSQQPSQTDPPDNYQLGYSRFQYECCMLSSRSLKWFTRITTKLIKRNNRWKLPRWLA